MRQLRDELENPVSLDYFHQRTVAGWKLKAVEWERADEAVVPIAVSGEEPKAAPYGIEVVPDTARLLPKADEVEVLQTILELIVVQEGVSSIAAELNKRGYRTRSGKPWTSTGVFNLLPRITETAPEILKSEDWQARRHKAIS